MSVLAASPSRARRGTFVVCGILLGVLVPASDLLTAEPRRQAADRSTDPEGRDAKEQRPDFPRKTLGQWIEALKEEDNRELRDWASKALGPGGPYAKVAVPALLDAFSHKRPPDRSIVAHILAGYGPPVLPRLVQALKRAEAAVRAGAAEALGYVRPRALPAVPALMEAMKDPVPDVRAAAAESLGDIGRSADKAIPSLIAALRDKEEQVRAAAAFALSQMGRKAKPAVPALIVALKDKNKRVRDEAVGTLWNIGPDAKAAVPALIEALRNKKTPLKRPMIARTLGGIGPDAKEAVPALVDALQENDEELHRWAAAALGEIGPGAKAAVPALIASVKEGGKGIWALGEIGPEARAAVPVLMEALQSEADRFMAARSLGGIGPAAKAAVPALTAIARDRLARDWEREAAAKAIMKIDPKFAAKERMEIAYLNVRLGKVPSVKLAPRAPLSKERKQRIKKLIAELTKVENPDFGMSGTMTGSAFAPLPDQERFGSGLLTDHRLKTSAAVRSLVEIGPDALPFLLEALGDSTPTKLKIQPFGFPGFGGELAGNLLNPLERRILSEEAARGEGEEDDGRLEEPYTLKVGDVCFVAIGQIVGRPYRAVRYQPSAMVIINSPLETKALRERVRAIWSSNNPAQKLLDSLLHDFATQGVFDGESLDGWDEGSNFQVEAALRLLYYFPQETAPLIAARLRSLDVQKPGDSGWIKREVKNGVLTIDFLKAVSWCKVAPIKKALADLARRTNDPEIKAQLANQPGR